MKIYAIKFYNGYFEDYEKFFVNKKKAKEYLKECYKFDKENLKGDIPKIEDLHKGEKRYELLKDRYYVKYWEKTSYEYNEWDITASSKRIIEIEVEE